MTDRGLRVRVTGGPRRVPHTKREQAGQEGEAGGQARDRSTKGANGRTPERTRGRRHNTAGAGGTRRQSCEDAARRSPGEAHEDGAGVGFDVAVPGCARGGERRVGHCACSCPVDPLVAVGEECSPRRLGIGDQQRRFESFVDEHRFGEPIVGVVVVAEEVVENSKVVSDRGVVADLRGDDLVVVRREPLAEPPPPPRRDGHERPCRPNRPWRSTRRRRPAWGVRPRVACRGARGFARAHPIGPAHP